MTITGRGILTYLLLVVTFSLGPWLLVIHAHHLAVGFGLVTGVLMWMPATAACLTCRILRIDIASLGWNFRPIRFEVLAYLLPILYALPVYIACWALVPNSSAFAAFASRMGTAFGFPESPWLATFLFGLPVFATFGVITSIASALGEEIGWRGFLLPRLTANFGWRIGCLISGCIWAAWHYPLLLFADYNSGTPKLFALTCFTLMVIGDAYILGWLRLRSKSLWPCAMLHATHNLFVQAIFDRITAQNGRALYVTTEFGFGMVITVAITAFILWRNPISKQEACVPVPVSIEA
jgi:uncharacterized protein